MTFKKLSQRYYPAPTAPKKTSPFASRPFAVQPERDFHRPPALQETENDAFQRHKYEAGRMSFEAHSGMIASHKREHPAVPQARISDSSAPRTERASHFAHDFSNIPVSYRQDARTQIVAQTTPREGIGRASTANKPNGTGLPDRLKASIENLSGLSMDDVRVHQNSSEPRHLHAHAFTWGADIHLGPGQAQYLPHEAWHVVQQKQGRARPTHVLANGAPLNADPVLEREADHMGDSASSAQVPGHLQTSVHSLVSQSIQRQAMQFKKAPKTAFGEFETTKFAEADGRGVEIILKFHPDESKVDAKKIALVQSAKGTLSSGAAAALDPTQAGRMVASGKSGAGYSIDRARTNNPIYGTGSLGAAATLKDTPASANTTADATEVGTNTTYELGYCYKEKPTDATKKKQSAGLWDKPQGGKNKGESTMFETTALAIEGTDKNKYYGSVTWGYKMEGTTAAPTVTKFDIDLASKGTPTANFIEPAKLWNVGKTVGTIQVTADPEATVLKGDASGTEKLAKDTKIKQLDTVMWGADPAIKAEVLKADGTGSGKIIYIKVSDAKDTGAGGTANKELPIPAVKPAAKKP